MSKIEIYKGCNPKPVTCPKTTGTCSDQTTYIKQSGGWFVVGTGIQEFSFPDATFLNSNALYLPNSIQIDDNNHTFPNGRNRFGQTPKDYQRNICVHAAHGNKLNVEYPIRDTIYFYWNRVADTDFAKQNKLKNINDFIKWMTKNYPDREDWYGTLLAGCLQFWISDIRASNNAQVIKLLDAQKLDIGMPEESLKKLLINVLGRTPHKTYIEEVDLMAREILLSGLLGRAFDYNNFRGIDKLTPQARINKSADRVAQLESDLITAMIQKLNAIPERHKVNTKATYQYNDEYFKAFAKGLGLPAGSTVSQINAMINGLVSNAEVSPPTPAVVGKLTLDVINQYIDILRASGYVAIKRGERVPYGEIEIKDEASFIKKLKALASATKIQSPLSWNPKNISDFITKLKKRSTSIIHNALITNLKKTGSIIQADYIDGYYRITCDAGKIWFPNDFYGTLQTAFVTAIPNYLNANHIFKNTKFWILLTNDTKRILSELQRTLRDITITTPELIRQNQKQQELQKKIDEQKALFDAAIKRKDYDAARTAFDEFKSGKRVLYNVYDIEADPVGLRMKKKLDILMAKVISSYVKAAKKLQGRLRTIDENKLSVDMVQLPGKKLNINPRPVIFIRGEGDIPVLKNLLTICGSGIIKEVTIFHGGQNANQREAEIKKWCSKARSLTKLGGGFENGIFGYVIVLNDMPSWGNMEVRNAKNILWRTIRRN